MSRLERAKEFASPVSGVHARMRFEMHHGGLDVLRALALLLLLEHFGALHADTIGEIDESAQKRTKLTDRVAGEVKVIPACFHDVRQKLAVTSSVAHEFEDQKFTKTQRQEALEVSGNASWLSLLSSRV